MVVIKQKYVYEDVDRHGRVRRYLKLPGCRKVRIRAKPGTDEYFLECQNARRRAETGELKSPPITAAKPETLRFLFVQYMASSRFRQLDPRTQRVTHLILDDICREPVRPGSAELFADCPIVKFTPRSVVILRDRKAELPEGANNRLRRLRAVFKWVLKPENRHLDITENPTSNVDFLKPNRVGGFPVWTSTDIEQFEARHPLGSKGRLALGLLMCTGARRSDVVRLGKQHVKEGRLIWRQHKGRNRQLTIIDIPILSELREILDASPTGDMTFLVTEQGRAFTANGFGNWFRDRCSEAGLVNLSAHGLRKASATRLAEHGAPTAELMAVYGWRSIKQAENYTREANRSRLAASGMQRLEGTKRVEKFPTSKTHKSRVGKMEAKK